MQVELKVWWTRSSLSTNGVEGKHKDTPVRDICNWR